MEAKLRALLAQLETRLAKSKALQFMYTTDDAAFVTGGELELESIIDSLKEILG
jgi:hypothetical protein